MVCVFAIAYALLRASCLRLCALPFHPILDIHAFAFKQRTIRDHVRHPAVEQRQFQKLARLHAELNKAQGHAARPRPGLGKACPWNLIKKRASRFPNLRPRREKPPGERLSGHQVKQQHNSRERAPSEKGPAGEDVVSP